MDFEENVTKWVEPSTEKGGSSAGRGTIEGKAEARTSRAETSLDSEGMWRSGLEEQVDKSNWNCE